MGWASFSKTLHSWEHVIHRSAIGRLFRLEGSGHSKEIRNARFFTELRAGLTTFATMAYIIAVNSSIITDSGGTCVCPHTKEDPLCMQDKDYSLCLLDIKRDTVTATAAIAGLCTVVFGVLTNLPIALAPGMGLNAYFTYQVVGFHGTGKVPYRLALTAIFIEGFIFLFLALTGIRHWLVKAIPSTIKTATGVGIGLFLTVIGLSYSAGIGAITGSKATPLTIAGCPPQYLDSVTGQCTQKIMTSPRMWLGICVGGLFTAYLMAFRVKPAFLISIFLVSILSWPRNTPVTFFPHTPEGDDRFNFFKKIVTFQPIKRTLGVLDWHITGHNTGQFLLALFTFLYVDIIDCTATLYSMARLSGVVREDGDFPRSTLAYSVDATCISVGSLLGLSPVTAFVESGSGISAGGRTGLTAVTTGVCFLLSIFAAPIMASIPPWATGCTLIMVGCLMIRQITEVNWNYIGDALPSFVAIFFIPLSFSVSYGLIASVFVYVALNSFIWLTIKASGGRLIPDNYDQKRVWNMKQSGRKHWIVRLLNRNSHKRVDSGEKGEVDSSLSPVHQSIPEKNTTPL